MKKALTLIPALVLCLSLVACGGDTADTLSFKFDGMTKYTRAKFDKEKADTVK